MRKTNLLSLGQFALIFSLLFSFRASAGAASCPELIKKFQKTTLHRLYASEDHVCSLGIEPSDFKDFNRRISFSQDGEVSIIVQVNSKHKKNPPFYSKSYLIFPFGEIPTLVSKNDTGSQFVVRSGSGQYWHFDAHESIPTNVYNSANAKMTSDNDCVFNINGNFSASNVGMDISSCKHRLVLEPDLPVIKNGEVQSDPTNTATLRDSRGNKCQKLKYSDFYNYPKRGHGGVWSRNGKFCYNPSLKFNSNAALGSFLKDQCPGLDLSMLNEPRAAAPATNKEEDAAK